MAKESHSSEKARGLSGVTQVRTLNPSSVGPGCFVGFLLTLFQGFPTRRGEGLQARQQVFPQQPVR
jgi:hypothetical protein